MANERLESIIEAQIKRFHARELNCAETVVAIMAEYWGEGGDYLPRIATAFGGGLAGKQALCGAISGGLMAIGLKVGRRTVGDSKDPAYRAGAAFLDWAKGQASALDCRQISDTDMQDPAQAAAFRAPGGGHETVCEPLVAAVCRHLAEVL